MFKDRIVMGYGHASKVAEFINTKKDTLIGQLVNGVASTGISTHTTTQVQAWGQEISLLQEQLSNPPILDWFVVLEYEIPRRSRRPDVVLLSPTSIFVIEFKVGGQSYDSASRWQVNSYARDLRDFHEESHGRRIIPILCATSAQSDHLQESHRLSESGNLVTDLVTTNGSDLGSSLAQFEKELSNSSAPSISPERWLNSPYRPTPTIIEAATALYESHDVSEISHHYAQNLDQTTDMLLDEIGRAKEHGRHVICFVTGVPGAGKTLTGLNVVHSQGVNQSSSPSGIFLSGNGPLVKIVREAIIRSQVAKGNKRRDCEREATTFVQNVHNFLRFHWEERREEFPHEHVVVFDEAQRAWDLEQMYRKRKIDASEATLLLDVMERFPDWAVIVALVGGGQEIFVGEAGLGEWGRALERRRVPWRVVASPEVLTGGDSVAGYKLFEGEIPPHINFRRTDSAHLDVVMRSHRAQRWAEWVNEFLSMRFDSAAGVIPASNEFPCFLTRNFNHAKGWLKMCHEVHPEERMGLVATSDDQRLRADGLERASGFRLNYPFPRWFLDKEDDIRSSFSLEVAASEFECQGLELDWVGLCWGGDLLPSSIGLAWDYRKFRGSKWQYVRQDAEQTYTLNRYRVLLTRARKGLVMWVPQGDRMDPTRDPEGFNRVFDALVDAGVPQLEDHFTLDELTSLATAGFEVNLATEDAYRMGRSKNE